MLYEATIRVLVEANSEAEACDAIAEGLRPILRKYADNPAATAWLDWQYANTLSGPLETDGSEFVEWMEG